MTGDGSFISVSESADGGSLRSAAAAAERYIKIGLPLLVLVFLLYVYSFSLVSPGLLDEQYLLAWLKSVFKLHGSSGFGGFLLFQGLDPMDNWGLTTKLFLLVPAFLFGNRLFFFKFILLVLHCLCTFLTYRCSRKIGVGWSASLIAAILFAFYPLHFEATAWLGGIGSELAAAFFLAALYIYLNGRQAPTWRMIALCGLFMLLALTSSSLIWPGCLAFGLFEIVCLLIPGENKERRDVSLSVISVLVPVILAGVYLACLGGLAAPAANTFSVNDILSFLRRCFLPVNEINWKHYSKEYRFFYILYPFLGISLLGGACLSAALKRTALYSLLLFALLALPVSNMALLSSELYGQRWLYAASAPLCLFLACCIAGLGQLPGKLKIAGNAVTFILALAMAVLFFQNLANEIAANRNVARLLKSVQKSIKIKQEKDNPPFLIVNDLPEKISVSKLYSPTGPVLFDAGSGLMRSNPLPDGRLKDLLREGQLRQCCLRWDKDLHCLLSLDLGPEKSSWPEKMNAEQFAAHIQPPLAYYRNASLSADKSELLLDSNSENGPAVSIDPWELSTLDGDYLCLLARIEAPRLPVAPRIELHWQTRVHPNYEKRQRHSYVEAVLNDGNLHGYLLSLRGSAWTTGGIPTVLTIGFPAGARVRLKEAGLVRAQKYLLPTLTASGQDGADVSRQRFTPPYFNYPVDARLGLVALADRAENLLADYSAADIAGASGVVAELSYPDRQFQDANSNHLSGQTYKTFCFPGRSGRINIPVSGLPGRGVYSLRVIARDDKGSYLGQFSDPVCFQVAGCQGGRRP
jgi:hypothetical protein